MEFITHKSFTEIDESEWNTLLQKSSADVPFLRYGYLKRWWQYRGGGEWPDAELHIISARDQGNLVGITPFFKARHAGLMKLLLLGSIEISDYLDLIYATDHADEFFDQLFQYLSGSDYADVQSISLHNIPEHSPSLTGLERIGSHQDWKLAIDQEYHTPVIHLANDWDTYLAGLDKKQRHEIRRKLRRAEEFPEMFQWHLVNERGSLDKAVEDFFDLMVLDPEKSNFLTTEMRKQMHSIIDWAFAEKILQFSFLAIDNVNAAAYLCFDYGNRIWVYNSGFDQRFSEYSPGWVLLSYLIRSAIQNGKQNFDFMRGDELYKYRFGGVDGFVMKAELTRPD
jgi:CelD/BcsL family acetyltransferase involved in cellulose biosynthesis